MVSLIHTIPLEVLGLTKHVALENKEYLANYDSHALNDVTYYL